MPRILWICILSFCALCSKLPAQTPITIKHNFLYVDVGVEHHGKKHVVPAMIDTGCSYCVLDSTFAVDSCGFEPYVNNTKVKVGGGMRIGVFKTILKNLCFADASYHDVPCYIMDLKSKLLQYTPNVVIGANILKRDLWKIDLSNNLIVALAEVPKQSAYVLKWGNHQDYPNTFLDVIVLKGKVAGKKHHFIFDTGSRRNQLPQGITFPNGEIRTIEMGHAGKALSLGTAELFPKQTCKIGAFHADIDFWSSIKSMGTLNADMFADKSFVLDYKKKRLHILD